MGVALADKGLRRITLRDAYYAWVDLLYMVVEIENAILNDFRIRNEPLTNTEVSGNGFLTPVKVHELALAHERLVTGYLNHVLDEPMWTLWKLMIGLLGLSDLDASWMRNQFTRINSAQAARKVISFPQLLRNTIKQKEHLLTATNETIEDNFGWICDQLEHEDRRVVRELKLALRSGIIVFEDFEQDTLHQGSDRLLAILQDIPLIVERFYERLSSQLEL